MQLRPSFGNKAYEDERGWFVEFYNENTNHLVPSIKQLSQSYSKRGVWRGLHLQPGMRKAFRVLHGLATFYTIDLNILSPAYLRWKHEIFWGSDGLNQGFIVVDDFVGAGFLALDEGTIVEYLQSDVYDPNTSYTVNANTIPDLWQSIQTIAYEHQIDNLIISDHDKQGMSIDEWKKLCVEKYI
jgi:dTDP-4-dehydrorhamnose 3,5-epimerase-like enzyme